MAQDTPDRPKMSLNDIIDIVIKILGGSLLALITFLINTNNDIGKAANDLKQQEIENIHKNGEFAQSMIQSLISKDTTGNPIMRDMAFTVLNGTIVGDSNDIAGKKLIARIGYCIISDYYANPNQQDTTSNMKVILEIIKERDLSTYKKCVHIINNYNDTRSLIGKKEQDKIVDKLKRDSTIAISANMSNNSLDRLTLLDSDTHKTIFIQINDESKRNDINAISDTLKKSYFNIPALQVIQGKYPNAIKYFYDADAQTAQTVHDILLSTKKTDSIPIKRVINDKARPGIVEVWFNFLKDGNNIHRNSH